MEVYQIEIYRFGERVKVFSTTDFAKAKQFYRKYTDREDCSTELYINGVRLKYGQAWDLMSPGVLIFGFPFRGTKAKRRFQSGFFLRQGQRIRTKSQAEEENVADREKKGNRGASLSLRQERFH